MNAELQEKIDRAIAVLRENEPKDDKGYALAFSGGKDSCVIKQLAIEVGVKFNAFYSVTTIDPPELVRFIKENHKDVVFLYNPKGGFFKRLIEHGYFPSMFARWCCREFKEQSLSAYGTKVIGVRASESIRRAKLWKESVEDKTNVGKRIICPIVHWTDEDVWGFIKKRNLPYCKLYDKGFKRLGCLNCPIASKKTRLRQLKENPSFEKAYLKAADLMWKRWHNHVKSNGKLHIASKFGSGKEWYDYWVSRKPYDEWKMETCQMELMFTGAAEEEAVK